MLALCLGVANAELIQEKDYVWESNDYVLLIKSSCTLEEVVQLWHTKHDEKDGETDYTIRFVGGNSDEEQILIQINESSVMPAVGEIDFTGYCNLTFNDISTITGELPMIFVGAPDISSGVDIPSKLTITFSDDAISKVLSNSPDPSLLTEHTLISAYYFGSRPTNQVDFVFGDAKKGQKYSYNGGEQVYLNMGIVPETELKPDSAALYFKGGVWDPELHSAAGSFTVAFVGSNYTPTVNTPEPTTGTLSLLALAGLAARRRRK